MASKLKFDINKDAKVSINVEYDPSKKFNINKSTKLDVGISLGQFCGGRGNPGKLNTKATLSELRKIARNLIPQAQILRAIRNDSKNFEGLFLDIVEGIYSPETEDEEVSPNSFLEKRMKGLVVVYELTGLDGIINAKKTFELADYISKNFKYKKVILDYDTMDPSGSLNPQIIVEMPEIQPDGTGNFTMEVETVFNGKLQEKSILEILSEDAPDPIEIQETQAAEVEIIDPIEDTSEEP